MCRACPHHSLVDHNAQCEQVRPTVDETLGPLALKRARVRWGIHRLEDNGHDKKAKRPVRSSRNSNRMQVLQLNGVLGGGGGVGPGRGAPGLGWRSIVPPYRHCLQASVPMSNALKVNHPWLVLRVHHDVAALQVSEHVPTGPPRQHDLSNNVKPDTTHAP
jgi:hypothetical protein